MRFIYSKAFLWFSICLVVLVALLFFQSRGWLSPVEYIVAQAPRPLSRLVNSIVSPVKNFTHTVGSLRQVVDENARLQSDLLIARQQAVESSRLASENDLLRQELGFKKKSALNLHSCSVISRDPEQLADALVIDCGESQQIKEGQAVLSQGYLVGKVFHVGKFSSTVFLITNAQSSVDAQIIAPKADRVTGVVKGSFGSGIIMDFISQNAPLNKGDLITTAGISDVIPKDILIGEVGQQLSKPEDLFKKASIVSPIDFRNLDFVFIVQP
jgi:rod shape-determining protein MreC